MAKYKVAMYYPDGTSSEEDEVFTSESAANEYGLYCIGCYHTGAEILHLSNPGDYPPDDPCDEVTFQIIEVGD